MSSISMATQMIIMKNWFAKQSIGMQVVLMTIAGTAAIFASAFALGQFI